MEYLAWNDALAAYFFKSESASKRVHLCVTASVIEAVSNTGDGRRDFIAAIKTGPPWVTRQGVCQKAVQAMLGWRTRDLLYPPYIGYLSLFVLAAGVEGDFAPHAYYPRLRTLLDEPSFAGQYPSFDRMLGVWDDLARWANDDMRGQLGLFHADIAGGWINVGIPVAQVIFTEQERQVLSVIFAEAGVDPAFPPSDEQMAVLLLAKGQHRLRARTLQLLEASSPSDRDVKNLLIATALEELSEWDGQTDAEGGRPEEIHSPLRICGRVDRIARRGRFSLRCHSSRDFPDEGLVVQIEGVDQALRCTEYLGGWSSELTLGSGEILDSTAINWLRGCSGRASQLNWRFRLPPSNVKVFEEGALQSLPGIVEVPRIPRQRSFYLACRAEVVNEIERWGQTGCRGFKDLKIEIGLPEGWRLFSVEEALSDELVKKRFPALAFNSSARIYFDGGLRSTGNQYFSFALPKLILDISSKADLFCNDIQLQQENGRYAIPESSALTGRLAIEARLAGEIVATRSLFVSDFISISNNSTYFGDNFGRHCEESSTKFVQGPLAPNETPPYHGGFLPWPHLSERRTYLGRVPGQIATLTKGQWPADWEPVWVIAAKGRKGIAIYCGGDLDSSAPDSREGSDRKLVKQWKQLLWFRRKRIEPPAHASINRLWLAYQEAAKEL